MKRTLLVLALLLAFCQTTDAQSYHRFLNDTLYWDVAFAEMGYICGAYSDFAPRRFAISGDTMINGKQYSTYKGYPMAPIYHPAPPNCSPFYVDTMADGLQWGIMREDTLSRKVYLYDTDDEVERLWYDFNAQVGDTIEYPWYGYFIVDTIYDIITSDGITRKYFEYFDWWNAFYIEGLGGPGGPFYDPFQYFESGPWLMCIKGHQGQSIWGDDCYDFTTDIAEKDFQAGVKIYPNPVRDKIHIEVQTCPSNLTIYNTLGQIRISQTLNAKESSIDLSWLDDGMYYIVLWNENEIPVSFRFIKK